MNELAPKVSLWCCQCQLAAAQDGYSVDRLEKVKMDLEGVETPSEDKNVPIQS